MISLWEIANFDEARGGSESPKNVISKREREREKKKGVTMRVFLNR